MSRVKAVVRVTLDIEDDSVWGGDVALDHIAKDAESGVRNVLTGGNDLALKSMVRRIRNIELVEVRVLKEKEVR